MSAKKRIRIRPAVLIGTMIWVPICAFLLAIFFDSTAIAASTPPTSEPGLSGAGVERSTLDLPMDLTPSADGGDLEVKVYADETLDTALYAIVGVGPGHQQGSYALGYSSGEKAYTATIPGFSPETTESGPIEISNQRDVFARPVEYIRHFVPFDNAAKLMSQDGQLTVDLIYTDTLAFDTYVTIVPTIGLRGSVPSGYRTLGQAYSIKAPHTVLFTHRPMVVAMSYEPSGGVADHHTYSLFAWNEETGSWIDLAGLAQPHTQTVTAVTDRFSTYVLMATTTWRSRAADFSSLDLERSTNFAFTPVDGELLVTVDTSSAGGTVVTQPIIPGETLGRWGTLRYTASSPAQANLAVDVLSTKGDPLLTGLEDGADLGSIDVGEHPSLRLRARMSSTPEAAKPLLADWAVDWQTASEELFLPIAQVE